MLRGIAASVVVFHHFALAVRDYSPRDSWINDSGLGGLGACGVDIFFVISGFIMVYTTTRKEGARDALSFLKKRALRIYPLYWFWTTVLFLLWAVGFALKSHHYPASYLVNSYLLIPSAGAHNYEPLLAQGWTLSFEMFFYLVFSFAILFKLKRAKLVLLAATFGALSIASKLLPAANGIRPFLEDPIIIEFLFGVLAAQILLLLPAAQGMARKRAVAITLIAIGAVALLCTVRLGFPGPMRFAFWGIPGLFLVFGAALLGSMPCPRWLVYLGDASYSIYLTHGFCSLAYSMAIKHFPGLGRVLPDAAILLAGIATIVLCSFTYPLVERRLSVGSRKKTLASRPKSEVPVS